MLDSRSLFTHPSVLHIPPSFPSQASVSCAICFAEAGLLLNSMGVITRSQHAEESALLRCRIDELNKNTVILIAQAEKLIQESEKLSARVKALENT